MSDAHRAAARWLAERSPVLRELHARVGEPRLPRRSRSAFESLSRAIVSQQLAGAAADTIWGRVGKCVGRPFTPERLVGAAEEELKAAGLSRAKLLALRDLAEKAKGLRLSQLNRLEDEAVVERLIAVRGIGRWTAEMFLIFHLRRLDVWPTGDLGVREGFRRAFGLPGRPSSVELLPFGEEFRPYRSVAAWYMWRAVEVLDGSAT